jgi:MOSC domain-containing protein YiiM
MHGFVRRPIAEAQGDEIGPPVRQRRQAGADCRRIEGGQVRGGDERYIGIGARPSRALSWCLSASWVWSKLSSAMRAACKATRSGATMVSVVLPAASA